MSPFDKILSENNPPEAKISNPQLHEEQNVGGEVSVDQIPKEIEQKLLNPDNWDEEKGNQQEQYQNFKRYLEQNPKNKDSIISLISGLTELELGDYIYENGYIINTDTERVFFHTLGRGLETFVREDKQNTVVIKQAEEEKVQAEKHETQAEKEKVRNFLTYFENKQTALGNIRGLEDILNNARPVLDSGENFEGQFQKINQQISSFFQNLQKNPQDFQKVAQIFYNESIESYQEYKRYALSINPSLISGFEEFENAPKTIADIPRDLGKAQIIGGLGGETEIKKYGSIVERNQGDGSIVSMNIGDIPPTRKISLEGNDYTLDTQVPIGDFYPAISQQGLEYEAVAKENTPKINILDGLVSDEIQSLIQSEDFKKETFQNALRIIATSLGVQTEDILSALGGNISSKEQLMQALLPAGINSKKEELQKKIDEKQKAYQEALKQAIKKYSENMKEKDEKTKEILQFLQDIGFTMIPQSISDDIIRQINLNPTQLDLGNGIHFNTAIDLKNGVLGTDIVGDNENTVKGIFSRFVNKMLTGDPDIPIVFSQNGQIRYNIAPGAQKGENPEMVGKGAFQMLVQQITGKANFDMIARNNLNMIPKAEK